MPEGFNTQLAPDEAFKLQRVIYGCKQGSARFFMELKEWLESIGFKQSSADPCLFISK